jgi:pimeloyl-ACP methyl ester carboxylesterase
MTGLPGSRASKPLASQLIAAGERKYTNIPVPILAIFAVPHDMGIPMQGDPATRAAFDAHDEPSTGAQARAVEKGLPTARVVRLPHASHFVFRSNEAEVLHEIGTFIAGLP